MSDIESTPRGAQPLAVASLGDPRDRGTWSGTPANIVQALEVSGCQVLTVDASVLGHFRPLAYFALHQVMRAEALKSSKGRDAHHWLSLMRSEARSDFHRGAGPRRERARNVTQALRATGVTRVLHMTSLALPLDQTADGAAYSHYLFCDSTWHTSMRYLQAQHRFTPRLQDMIERNERAALASVTHFFPTARYVRDDLVAHYGIDPARVTVVGTGRGNEHVFNGRKDYATGHILFTAKVRFEEKGGALLLEGFRLAQQQMPHLRLVLVGQETYPDRFRDLPNVKVYGHVSQAVLREMFDKAALFAMPALNEPWGLAYLEALASKTPILGLRRNAFPELACDGRYGFIVEEPSPREIAANLLRAFSDPRHLATMGEAGQRYCLETFSWDRVASDIKATVFASSQMPGPP